jgi:hypothetical protein
MPLTADRKGHPPRWVAISIPASAGSFMFAPIGATPSSRDNYSQWTAPVPKSGLSADCRFSSRVLRSGPQHSWIRTGCSGAWGPTMGRNDANRRRGAYRFRTHRSKSPSSCAAFRPDGRRPITDDGHRWNVASPLQPCWTALRRQAGKRQRGLHSAERQTFPMINQGAGGLPLISRTSRLTMGKRPIRISVISEFSVPEPTVASVSYRPGWRSPPRRDQQGGRRLRHACYGGKLFWR